MSQGTDLNPQQVRRFVESFRQALIQFRRKHYELGGFLLRVREEYIYRSWPRINEAHDARGYTSWDAFCEPETGYATRTCDQFIQNYSRLREFELEENDVDGGGLMFARCMRIGWSKLAVVLRFVDGPNNRYRDGVDQLELSVAAAEAMPEQRLRSYLAGMRRDTALDQARATTGNPDLQPGDEGTGSVNEPLAPDNAAGFVPYNIRFDNTESLDTFTRAVDLIQRRYNSRLGVGRCVSMMALHYLATHARDNEGGAVLDAETLIQLFEDALGVRLQVAAEQPTRRTTKKKTSKKKVAKKKASKKVARRRRQRTSEAN